MDKVVLEADFAARLRDRLRDQQDAIKVAADNTNALLKKVAELQEKNDVLTSVLSLVVDGALDASVALMKVAEFTENPDRLKMFKAAHELGFDRFDTRLGTSATDAGLPKGGNPIEECLIQLRDQGAI